MYAKHKIGVFQTVGAETQFIFVSFYHNTVLEPQEYLLRKRRNPLLQFSHTSSFPSMNNHRINSCMLLFTFEHHIPMWSYQRHYSNMIRRWATG